MIGANYLDLILLHLHFYLQVQLRVFIILQNIGNELIFNV